MPNRLAGTTCPMYPDRPMLLHATVAAASLSEPHTVPRGEVEDENEFTAACKTPAVLLPLISRYTRPLQLSTSKHMHTKIVTSNDVGDILQYFAILSSANPQNKMAKHFHHSKFEFRIYDNQATCAQCTHDTQFPNNDFIRMKEVTKRWIPTTDSCCRPEAVELLCWHPPP
jgi:hypothetical protein